MVKAFTIVSLRILASWVIFQGLAVILLNASCLTKALALTDGPMDTVTYILTHGTYLAVGLITWWKAPIFANFIMRDVNTDELTAEIQISRIVAAGSFLIGLYWFTLQLPYLAQTIMITFMNDHAIVELFAEHSLNMWVTISISLILMIKSQRIGRLL